MKELEHERHNVFSASFYFCQEVDCFMLIAGCVELFMSVTKRRLL